MTELTPWTCLTAGIPLTLLVDLAAGDRLDSTAILAAEEAARLAAAEWAETQAAGTVERGASGVA